MADFGPVSEIRVGDRFYSYFYGFYVTAASNARLSPNGECWDVDIQGHSPMRFGKAATVKFN